MASTSGRCRGGQEGERLTQSSTMLLTGSLGAVFIILALYADIFAFERRAYIVQWFAGWTVIALNYVVDAFFPDLLRGNRLVFLISTASFFYANFLLFYGNRSFLGIKNHKPLSIGASAVWLMGLFGLSHFFPEVALIAYVNAAIFFMTFHNGVEMIHLGRKQGGIVLFLGIVNIAWVLGAILFSYVLQVHHIVFYAVMHGMRFINAIGLIQMCFSNHKNKTERWLEYIQQLSEHDELTGLYNKSYFDAKVLEFDRAEDCLPVSLIIGDMNGLKFVNDVFGHQEGDNRIRKAAYLLKGTCRKEDIIARWGGDEFAILLLRTGRDEANAILGSIREACAAQRDADIPVSISMGLATKTGMETSLTDVLRASEKAMYETKLVEGKKARCAILKTIEARMAQMGYETKERTERLQSLAAEFARALGLPSDSRADLLTALKYLDIGKIGLPDEVVRREACLDEREWTVLKKHVEIGYRIVCALGERTPVADAVLCQHESWDGQGFPQGLKGEEIPLLARVITILRAYDGYSGQTPSAPDAAISGQTPSSPDAAIPGQTPPAPDMKFAALEALQLSADIRFDSDLLAQFASMMAEKTMTRLEAEKEVCVR